MSRFWAAAASSDSDSSSDASSMDDESEVERKDKWVMSDSESDSEDEVRVVKSTKDRTFASLEASVASIRNAMKIRDYAAIQSHFESVVKNVSSSRTQAIIVSHGGVPRFFVKMLVDLDDYIEERKKDKVSFKKLSATQGRALNRMGLTLKKHNKQYEKLIIEYRENPGILDGDDLKNDDDKNISGSDDSDSDSRSTPVVGKKKTVVSDSSESDSDSSSSSSSESESDSDSSSTGGDSSSSSDSDDDESTSSDEASESDEWESSESSSSDSEDEGAGAYGQLKGRARWLKRVTEVKEKVVKDKEGRGKARAEAKAAAAAARETLSAKEEAEAAKGGGLLNQKVTVAILDRKVKEVVASRGRKGTDVKAILRQLENLSKLAVPFGSRIEVPILMHVVAAQFDLIRTLDEYMDTHTWKTCAVYLNRILSVLEDGKEKYTLSTSNIDEDDLMVGNILSSGSAISNKMKVAVQTGDVGARDAVSADVSLINPHTGEVETLDERNERIRVEQESKMSKEQLLTIHVIGSLTLFLTRLDEEYNKSLQRTYPHTVDYVIRLRDESKLVGLLAKGQRYYERVASVDEAAQLALLRLEHLYYRHDSIAEKVDRAASSYTIMGDPVSFSEEKIEPINYVEVIEDLCSYIYQYGSDRNKTRAMLCHIYHHALHNRFLEARDLLLMSHLQDTISNVGDISTMILFNRMMVTLGLSAFRQGRIKDAHQCFFEICSGRVRELLAQGINTGRFAADRSAEEEKAEKRRQVPYHQHINLDLLEASHLISAMLLEVPNMAAGGDDANGVRRTKVISRTFRKNHDIYDRQVFTGPPEQTRDYVMRASRALMRGDWRGCADLLIDLDVWKLIPGDDAVQQIHSMLVEKIKLEALRTYLFAFSAHYDSLSLQQLCGMFQMSKNEVHSIVSKMMINHELHASWDQLTETIVLQRVEPSNLQLLALQFAEKAAGLVEANERLLDAKSGNYFYRDDSNWKSGGDQRDGRGYQNALRRPLTPGRGAPGRGGRGRGGRGFKQGGRRPRS